jgi:hypothetical protein
MVDGLASEAVWYCVSGSGTTPRAVTFFGPDRRSMSLQDKESSKSGMMTTGKEVIHEAFD